MHAFSFYRLVFTRDRVGDGAGNFSIYRKQRSDSAYNSVAYDKMKTRLSKSQAEAEELNQSQSVG